MRPCEVKQSLVPEGPAQLLHVLSQQRCFYSASRATSAGRGRHCASFSSSSPGVGGAGGPLWPPAIRRTPSSAA
ncbi:unnamed protein product [Arctogadus glacialis]